MSKLTLVIFVAVLSLLGCGQAKPPAAVADAFSKKFANATQAKWDMESDNEWEVEFKAGKQEMSANFDLAGTWLETEGEVLLSDLPAVIIKMIETDFPGFEVEEALTLDTPDFSGYEILIESKTEQFEITLTKAGEFVSKTVVSEEDEKGEKGEGQENEEE